MRKDATTNLPLILVAIALIAIAIRPFDLCWNAHHGPFSTKDEHIDIN
jgi:hypothetical protein